MGCDGGTICDMRDIVIKLKKSGGKPDRRLLNKIYWVSCRISNMALDPSHIVACKLGYMYNKDAVIEYIMTSKKNKLKVEPLFSHVRSLKDVATVHLTANPNFDSKKDDPMEKSLFIDPITRKEINPQKTYMLVRTCGHVFSEETQKQVHDSKHACLVCGSEYNKDSDLTVLNPPEEMEQELRTKLQADMAAEKPATKKRKAHDAGEDEPAKKKQKQELVIPKGATDTVYKSMFIEQTPEKKAKANDFLSRGSNHLILK